MKIKVCGMTDSGNINEVSALKPDFMGFIFYADSPRNVTQSLPETSDTIIRTGVFVNASEDEIREKSAFYHLKAIQFHGNESPEFLEKFSGFMRIKVFSVATNFDFDRLKPFEAVADYFLFDTKGERLGGNGTRFDWEILKKYPSDKPYFISGGIGPNDIQQLKDSGLKPFGIDINSKFETQPGIKNILLIQEFLKELRLCFQ
ncbi:phosphoribosylanthranilate isomerase [Flavobacterium silvaticum]|uniref:N-(5'-phosphoribosyl)anthranilate isomerase n=1 Tax=Flavobacterium silvaticum TaxID=1852020 RepID=A0A972FSN4_9FLAO|nr:phosphoribosylanthranilate isomerase [Flavobacterium silvaticum]NMH26810.1 phosphoribosylanthranilate isomerase [Flavobacterium silvaticum]